MNQQTVYQTVSVQDELPTESGRYFAMSKDGIPVILLMSSGKQVSHVAVKEWEKPATGYFFTPEEFREVVGQQREEIERLKELIESLVRDKDYNYLASHDMADTQEQIQLSADNAWQQFKTENNL